MFQDAVAHRAPECEPSAPLPTRSPITVLAPGTEYTPDHDDEQSKDGNHEDARAAASWLPFAAETRPVPESAPIGHVVATLPAPTGGAATFAIV